VDLQRKAELIGERTFLGVPALDFEMGGREQLIFLLEAGLTPESKVVDLGCGVLRAGYWLTHFLDRSGYCGIEPHQERLEIGKTIMLGDDLVALKRPRFDTNSTFDTAVFGEKFDFFLAYSIWTHASKPQIERTLDSFVRDSAIGARFLASYLPADADHPDYRGTSWHGTSHEADVPGCIHHSLDWIEMQCRWRGLVVRELGRDKTHGQSWLQIQAGVPTA
jgi:hypothetical protein